MATVEWRHSRKRLILPVVVMAPVAATNPNLSIRVEGLLDTGATGSGIHPRLVDELGLERKGQRVIATANGEIVAAEVMHRIGFIAGDYTDPDFLPDQHLPYIFDRSIIAFELQQGFGYAILIGMDVIGQCDLAVQRDGTASLRLP